METSAKKCGNMHPFLLPLFPVNLYMP